MTLSDIDPPKGYTISGEGTGGAAGHAKGSAAVRLEEEGENTILHYDVKAQVGGKIAQLGGRLIDSTAKKLAGQFFDNFSSIVAPPPEGEEKAEAADGNKKGWFGKMFGKKRREGRERRCRRTGRRRERDASGRTRGDRRTSLGARLQTGPGAA